MSKPRASYYARYGDLIVSATIADAYGPDGINELRVQVMRGFSEGMNYVEAVEADPVAPGEPSIDTTDLPPVE